MKFKKWGLIIVCFISINAFGNYKWEKVSPCFTPILIQVDKNIPASEIEDGCFYMLIDLQANLITNQNYYHLAYKITSENGVQNNAELQIEYNPAFQKLKLNSIKVYRSGKWIDYSTKIKIKEIQREADLEYHIYDETLTLYIILEDIRIGDVIEYSYTREGSNPIFRNNIYKTYSYQMSYTLPEFYLKIIKPKDLKLYINNQKTDFKPVINQSKYGEELIWQKSNIPGIKTEEFVPSWYNPYAIIEISSSNDWKEIRDWGRSIFKNSEPLNDSLKNICRKINNEQKTDADKVIAALRFVQKKIRYLGIEIGVSSHKPSSPNKVFNQGFGDCKDKSLLLSKILTELGIKAYPALVSTTYKERINEYLPSPTLFDHTIVKVELNNKNYWFDPTLTNQGGDINNYYTTPYGKALVLDGISSELDTIEAKLPSQINITEHFTVRDLAGNANLKVVTTYYGYDADEIRYSFASNSQQQIQESYLNFYKNSYLEIDTIGIVTFKDDSVNNEVTVLENYIIKDFWKTEDTTNNNLISASFTVFDINNKINSYQKKYSNRKSPLYLEYPLQLSHKIIIALPVEWGVQPSNQIINDDFFTFNYKSSYHNRTITLEYQLKTKKNFIPANKSPEFIADIEKVGNLMAYKLSYDKKDSQETGSINGILVILFLCSIIIFGFIGYMIYKKHIKPDTETLSIQHRNIGGWVILPIIGLFLSPVLSFYKLIKHDYFSDSMWQFFYNSQSTLYIITFLFEIIMQSIYIVLPVFLLVLAFRYNKKFPWFMIHFYMLNVCANTIDVSLVSLLGDILAKPNYSDLGKSIFTALIWIPFFYISERCKETFVK